MRAAEIAGRLGVLWVGQVAERGCLDTRQVRAVWLQIGEEPSEDLERAIVEACRAIASSAPELYGATVPA
jgi:hypothetical protein